jgi:hypothetical protein
VHDVFPYDTSKRFAVQRRMRAMQEGAPQERAAALTSTS